MEHESQKQIILNMLHSDEWVCVSKMMAAFIPDYRRRLCDLRDKGFNLECRWCENPAHNHRGNMKEWRLKRDKIVMWPATIKEVVQEKLSTVEG